MKVSPIFLILFCCLCLVVVTDSNNAQSTEMPSQWVLIDRSGSMRGFFATDQIGRLNSLVRSKTPGNFRSYYFIDYDLVSEESTSEGTFGHNTLLTNALGRVLQAKPRPTIVWFVTDNQPSGNSETESDKDLVAFYSILRSDTVKRLCFFPLKLPFNGDLYAIDRVLASYQGKRGLLVYALLLDENFKDEYEKSVSAFEANARKALAEYSSVNRVVIKPLDRETITASLVSIPNSKLRVEGGTIVGTDFVEGQPIEGTFGINLNSNFGSIRIADATIEAKSGEFRTNDFSPPNPSAIINPKVLKDFTPARPPSPFEVTLKLEPMRVETTVSSIWHSLGVKRGEINGEIFVSINVPATKFTPIEELQNEFSTNKNIFTDPSPSTQERIYKIGELMSQVLPNESREIRPRINNDSEGRIPIRLSASYLSGRRALYIIVPAAILLALIPLLIWLSRRLGTTKYRLTWSQEQYRTCNDFTLTPLLGRQNVEADRIVVASIKRSLAGIQVRARHGYVVDGGRTRQLNESGSDFDITRENDNRSIDFRFSQVTDLNRTGSNNTSGNESNGDLDNYGAPSLHDELDPTPPPVRMPSFNGLTGKASSGQSQSSSIDLDDLYK